MKCQDFRDNLQLFLDGEMATGEATEQEAHASECAACAQLLARQRQFKAELRACAAGDRMPDALRARLAQERERLAVHRHRREGWTRLRRVGVGLSAAAALLLGSFVLWSPPSAVGTGADAVASGEVAGLSALRTPVVGAALDWHQRRLPLDVLGPSPRHASAWFSENASLGVDFPAFGEGTTFLGARAGQIGDVPAAYAIYDAGGRKLSLLIYDAAAFPLTVGDDPQRSGGMLVDNSRERPVLVRESAGMGYALTGDLDEDALRGLVQAAVFSAP